ncbi:hypothetical protein PF010_g23885 [Phytophthora fragariae]|nr:hypothetical protein PF010_g23885 [Phytophthora fragariae]KAE9076545.1 hypothetical protein PF007_g24591 [Phytophthora fragariae]KAE9095937.1 hypothetical protein PF006_g23894 [Phytophthora fragariae]KAE9187465.1 hypothetical protein PF002_g25589 [Phytophthora fragariae]
MGAWGSLDARPSCNRRRGSLESAGEKEERPSCALPEDRIPIADRRNLPEDRIPIADRRNYRIVKATTNLSDHLMRHLLKERYLRRALMQTRPLLTENHKIERLKWCVGHVQENLERTFAAETAMALNKTCISIQPITEDIMKHDGGNAFRLRHMHKDILLRAGELAVSLSCDANI